MSLLGRLLALLLGVCLIAACAPGPAPEQAVDPGEGSVPDGIPILKGKAARAPTRAVPALVTILQTGDVRGAVDPCG